MQFIQQGAVIQPCRHMARVASKNPVPSDRAKAMQIILPSMAKIEAFYQDDWPVKDAVTAHSKMGLAHNERSLVKDAHLRSVAWGRTCPRWVLGDGYA